MNTPRRAREHNPFLMMVDPSAVMEAVERMERTEACKGRICRPLDRLSTPTGAGSGADEDGAERFETGFDDGDGGRPSLA